MRFCYVIFIPLIKICYRCSMVVNVANKSIENINDYAYKRYANSQFICFIV